MFGLFKRKRSVLETPARHLYEAAVLRAREPVFYTDLGVQDSVDGRFDMITLHVCLVLRRLEGEGEQAAELSQNLFDMMFLDMETNLRELGVGDVGMPKRMKKLIKAFYGRLKAYDEALSKGPAGEEELEEALRRNLYRELPVTDDVLERMAAYMRDLAEGFNQQGLNGFLRGEMSLHGLHNLQGAA